MKVKVTGPVPCEGTVSGIPGGLDNRCPNNAAIKVIESRLVTYWDTEENVTYFCPTHFNGYCSENDVTASELFADGWADRLPQEHQVPR
jgi:hypothetical protein